RVDACQRLDLGGRPRLTVRVLHPALGLDTDARAVALQVGVGDHGRLDVPLDGAVTADVGVGVDPSWRVEVAVQGGGLTDGDVEVDTERDEPPPVLVDGDGAPDSAGHSGHGRPPFHAKAPTGLGRGSLGCLGRV